MSWVPIRSSGWNVVAGSWNTIANSRPRSRLRARSESLNTSSPPNRTDPDTTAADGSRPMIVRAVIDLPDPDSRSWRFSFAGVCVGTRTQRRDPVLAT